ncbi:hypothetical protein [Pseudomonas viridiflava]|uniref:hypothetical protein n=1 Tax=Pseudomonas viridiflava TaxID=33069 RepID=UPI000F031FD2|nr:hypothetical protein [Pseudomonas viridiflava]
MRLGDFMSESKIFDVSGLTTTKVTIPKSVGTEFDFVARISGATASNVASVSVSNTDTLFDRVSHYVLECKKDVDVLRGVVKWQHRLIDYNSSYTALLMEQIDESEFEAVAASFAEAQVDMSSLDLAYDIERIHDLTGIDYTVMDYANMFGTTESAVESAARSIASGSVALRLWSEGGEG